MQLKGFQTGPPALAVVIEEDPLTCWSIKSCLTPGFDVHEFHSLEEAAALLEREDLRVVVCGAPLVERHPSALGELAEVPGRIVIALVVDSSLPMPANVVVLEKPFALARLTQVIESRASGIGR